MINDGQEKQISVVQRGEIEQPLVARVVIKATDENVAGLGEQFPVQVESGRPCGTLTSSFEGLDVRDILRGDSVLPGTQFRYERTQKPNK